MIVIPTLIGGGMERVASEFANYFSDKNEFKVIILMYGNNLGSSYKLSNSIQIIQPKNQFNNKQRILSTLKSILFIRSSANKLKPDYILSFGEYWNNFVLLSLLFTRHSVFISDRCQPDKSLGFIHDILRKCLYKRSKGFIVQTSYAKEIFKMSLNHTNITVIPNPVDFTKLEKIHQDRENIVLSVGRLIKSKNFDLLIKIFTQLNIPNWKLVIVGDDFNNPENINKLKNYSFELDSSNRIELVGHQSDVVKYYSKAKIFAFTSSSEGFPNVLIEAMSHELPVVAFDCSAGPSDIIQDGENGFLIPLFNEEKFSEALACLMNDEVKRDKFAKTASKSVKKFSIDEVSTQLKTYLNNS
jgi:GalNAc-alpha-(1->4)-GalNAc-alpha-(1->3)-diNAcBac-PP-undecaprenol alpha-1,4-N-acetyl-D-galactosaminyltransferase